MVDNPTYGAWCCAVLEMVQFFFSSCVRLNRMADDGLTLNGAFRLSKIEERGEGRSEERWRKKKKKHGKTKVLFVRQRERELNDDREYTYFVSCVLC